MATERAVLAAGLILHEERCNCDEPPAVGEACQWGFYPWHTVDRIVDAIESEQP